jgi:hypothetical protein
MYVPPHKRQQQQQQQQQPQPQAQPRQQQQQPAVALHQQFQRKQQQPQPQPRPESIGRIAYRSHEPRAAAVAAAAATAAPVASRFSAPSSPPPVLFPAATSARGDGRSASESRFIPPHPSAEEHAATVLAELDGTDPHASELRHFFAALPDTAACAFKFWLDTQIESTGHPVVEEYYARRPDASAGVHRHCGVEVSVVFLFQVSVLDPVVVWFFFLDVFVLFDVFVLIYRLACAFYDRVAFHRWANPASTCMNGHTQTNFLNSSIGMQLTLITASATWSRQWPALLALQPKATRTGFAIWGTPPAV